MRDRVWGPLFCPEKKTPRARSANCDVPLCMCLLDAVAQSLQPRCARCAMPCEWAHLGRGAAKGVAARGALSMPPRDMDWARPLRNEGVAVPACPGWLMAAARL